MSSCSGVGIEFLDAGDADHELAVVSAWLTHLDASGPCPFAEGLLVDAAEHVAGLFEADPTWRVRRLPDGFLRNLMGERDVVEEWLVDGG